MEELIKTVHALEDCFHRHNFKNIIRLEALEIKYVCYKEKLAAAKALQNISMKSNITERLTIMETNKLNTNQARDEELSKTWK